MSQNFSAGCTVLLPLVICREMIYCWHDLHAFLFTIHYTEKTMKSVAWMASYFDRVGDKRPDKDGIYLPTCLTERAIYARMADEISDVVCFSQFNKIFRQKFPNVSIPKVSFVH